MTMPKQADENEVVQLRRILNVLVSDIYAALSLAKEDLRELNDEYGRGEHARQRVQPRPRPARNNGSRDGGHSRNSHERESRRR